MSYQFQYYPEPGITYDIIRMLYVKLNSTSVWKETLTTVDSQEEHIRFIEEHASKLPEPDPDVSLFLYIPSNRKTTFLSSIVDELISKNFSKYSLNDLLGYINNIQQAKNDIFAFYFSDELYSSLDFEAQLRANRSIPDRIKLLLFGFSYNPAAFISKLNKTIQSYYSLIKKNWQVESASSKILNQFANKILKERPIIRSNEITEIQFSLCRCTPMHLLSGYYQDNVFFISTLKTIQENIRNELAYSTSELLQSIHSIDDQNRLEIIRFLKTFPGQSPIQIADRMNLSITATKYHLSILKKANMITFTRNNRNTFYSYNPLGYKSLLSALDYFEKGGFEK